jgi:hypothetical protein
VSRQQGSKNSVVVPGEGDPCPRCKVPMQIFEHREVTKKERRRPFHYSRWFRCQNAQCQTTTVMPARYRVWNCGGEKRANLEQWLGKQNDQRRAERETEHAVERGELVVWGDKWPDDDVTQMSVTGSAADLDERPPWE